MHGVQDRPSRSPQSLNLALLRACEGWSATPANAWKNLTASQRREVLKEKCKQPRHRGQRSGCADGRSPPPSYHVQDVGNTPARGVHVANSSWDASPNISKDDLASRQMALPTCAIRSCTVIRRTSKKSKTRPMATPAKT